MEAAIAELVKGKTLVAVSYTHLDVYKRQLLSGYKGFQGKTL